MNNIFRTTKSDQETKLKKVTPVTYTWCVVYVNRILITLFGLKFTKQKYNCRNCVRKIINPNSVIRILATPVTNRVHN